MNYLLTTRLEQSTTFGPFVGKLVVFSEIAGRTSQHDIANVVGGNVGSSSAAKWIGMLNMIDVFAVFTTNQSFEQLQGILA